MKTLMFLLTSALMAIFQATAAFADVDDSTRVSGATDPVIVCTVNNNVEPTFTSGMETEAVTCSCSEVYRTPQIKEIVSNPVYKTITVTGATRGDQIYILKSTGEILIHVEAATDNPKIDVSSLAPGSYTIGVQSY
ncbi:hypothetical protein SDC9_39300 [bioreactor metagenome]|uniref:Uncharacterized protein n=1 Tax=bioreactor metagenome TaxID=1076179 RepID=A0A644VP34_9ZZZZ